MSCDFNADSKPLGLRDSCEEGHRCDVTAQRGLLDATLKAENRFRGRYQESRVPLRAWNQLRQFNDSIKPARLPGCDGIGGAELRAGAVNLPLEWRPGIAG